MGLTVHYGVKTSTKDPAKAKGLIEKMRQIAMDLPFEKVGEIRYLGPKVCQIPFEDLRGNKPVFEMVLDGLRSITLPWTRKTHKYKSGGSSGSSCSHDIQPLEMYSFDVCPGPGSEWISLGFCRYPDEVEVNYRPKDDAKFSTYHDDGGMGGFRFNWEKWTKWLEKNGRGWQSPPAYEKPIKIKTRLSGWRWSSFCKTQYACEVNIQNFIRCHVSLITLLDKIAKLPTVKVDYDDEGKYGRSYYTDEPWAEKRVYTWHEGKYDVKALIEEVGEWNQMIAGMFGAMKDALGTGGLQIEGPITNYSNFEHLEFKGSQNANLIPFLQTMKTIANKAVAEKASRTA